MNHGLMLLESIALNQVKNTNKRRNNPLFLFYLSYKSLRMIKGQTQTFLTVLPALIFNDKSYIKFQYLIVFTIGD